MKPLFKDYVIGIGEALWDMLPGGKKLGGAPANFAYHARQFGLALEEKCRFIIRQYGLKKLILTCGINGSYVFYDEGMSFLETPKVKVADTLGAGDSFTGSFIGTLLNGKPIPEAHKTAVRISAYVCTREGAMPEIPDSLK